jgi:hypothetical protein
VPQGVECAPLRVSRTLLCVAGTAVCIYVCTCVWWREDEAVSSPSFGGCVICMCVDAGGGKRPALGTPEVPRSG